jgi:hypothetical protein
VWRRRCSSIGIFERSLATKTEGNARYGVVYDIRIRSVQFIGWSLVYLGLHRNMPRKDLVTSTTKPNPQRPLTFYSHTLPTQTPPSHFPPAS